ncbi:MAG: DegT/DnrJ/EryC1/StrS family aminotransferase [Planctomycetota bacterium]|jgi:perosamine synthetase
MSARHDAVVAESLGLPYTAFAGRGTTALWAALKVLIPEPASILVPANVCDAVIAAILHAGHRPRYVDVDPVEGLVTAETLTAASDPKCKALIAVHHFGTPLPMCDIMNWARDNNLAVIEDVCNAMGATCMGQPLGTFGDAAVFSFGHAKILNLGYGGLLASRHRDVVDDGARLVADLPDWSDVSVDHDKAHEACLRVIRRYHELQDPEFVQALFRSCRPALLAGPAHDLPERAADAIGDLPNQIRLRNESDEYYRSMLIHPSIVHRARSAEAVCWRHTFHVPPHARDRLVNHLRGKRLPVSTWFPGVDAVLDVGAAPGPELPGVRTFEASVINLFVEPEVDEHVVVQACDAVARAISRYALSVVSLTV